MAAAPVTRQDTEAPWSQFGPPRPYDELQAATRKLAVLANQDEPTSPSSDTTPSEESLAVQTEQAIPPGFVTFRREQAPSVTTNPTYQSKIFTYEPNEGEPSVITRPTDATSFVDSYGEQEGIDATVESSEPVKDVAHLLDHVGADRPWRNSNSSPQLDLDRDDEDEENDSDDYNSHNDNNYGAGEAQEQDLLLRRHAYGHTSTSQHGFSTILTSLSGLLIGINIVIRIGELLYRTLRPLKKYVVLLLEFISQMGFRLTGYHIYLGARHSANPLQVGLAYSCATQTRTNGLFDIQIGFDRRIPRWKPKSIIKYVIRHDSFKNGCDAQYVAEAIRKAIHMWRGMGVKFVYAACEDAATFQVRFGYDSNISLLARSFFPQPQTDTLHVFEPALQAGNKPYLANVLAHELGHIMGLRHEFAATEERHIGSVRWGDRNPHSVMNYFDHPSKFRVTPQDRSELATFYEFPKAEYNGLCIKDYVPERGIFKERTWLIAGWA